MLEQVSELSYFNAQEGVLLSFARDQADDIGAVEQITGVNTKIKKWGSDNDLPSRRDLMLMGSNIVGEIIQTKCDLTLGQGLIAYTKTFSDKGIERTPVPIRREVSEWLVTSTFHELYLEDGTVNYHKQGNIFVEFILDKGGRVLTMTSIDATHIRAAEKINGVIPGYYIREEWALTPKYNQSTDANKNKPTYVPAYDPSKKQGKFIYHIRTKMFKDGYYGHPPYWGGEEWIDVANMIPVFHKANITNGYTPRFHIKIPADYFLDKSKYLQVSNDPTKQAECIQAAENSKKAFITDVNALLAGETNGGRALFTINRFDALLKQYDGISIEPINFDMKDDALLALFEKSNDANISAQGFPRALAGIETQGKLSSGSEIRNILMYYIISKLPRPRQDILKPFYLMLTINGWADPDIFYTFEDIMITKLDDNKSGTAPAMGADDQLDVVPIKPISNDKNK